MICKSIFQKIHIKFEKFILLDSLLKFPVIGYLDYIERKLFQIGKTKGSPIVSRNSLRAD